MSFFSKGGGAVECNDAEMRSIVRAGIEALGKIAMEGEHRIASIRRLPRSQGHGWRIEDPAAAEGDDEVKIEIHMERGKTAIALVAEEPLEEVVLEALSKVRPKPGATFSIMELSDGKRLDVVLDYGSAPMPG